MVKTILPKGDDVVGIIHYIQSNYKNRNNFIEMKNSTLQVDSQNWGSIYTIVNYTLYTSEGQSNWCSKNIPNSNFTMIFKGFSIRITNYTFTTRNYNANDFPMNWKVEGSNNGKDWIYIDHKIDQKSLLKLGATKTFGVEKTGRYSQFRFVQNGTTSNKCHFFGLGKIDLFGELYITTENDNSSCMNKRNVIKIIHLFVVLVT